MTGRWGYFLPSVYSSHQSRSRNPTPVAVLFKQTCVHFHSALLLTCILQLTKTESKINRRKLNEECYRSAADMEYIKHCDIAIGLLYLSNQEKNSKVCGSSLRKKIVIFGCESAKSPANLQICGCGPPITILWNLRVRNRVQICGFQHCWKAFQLQRLRAKKYCTGRIVSLALHQRRNYHLSFSLVGLLLIETLLSVLQLHLFFGSDWLYKQPKYSSLLTDSTSLSLSPLSLSAP